MRITEPSPDRCWEWLSVRNIDEATKHAAIPIRPGSEELAKLISTLRTGGDAVGGDGAFMRLAVLTGVTKEMDAYSEEIFGPVAVVYVSTPWMRRSRLPTT